MGRQVQTPGGDTMSDPYEMGDRSRDIDAKTSPSAGWKAREDSVLAQQRGPIAPRTRVGYQLEAEDDAAGRRKVIAARRKMTKRAVGGKR